MPEVLPDPDPVEEFVHPDPPNALGPDDFPHPLRALDVACLIAAEYG